MYKVKVERKVYLKLEHTNMEMFTNACPVCGEIVSEDVRFPNVWMKDVETDDDYGMICFKCVEPIDCNLYITLKDARIEQERSFEE